jgi:ATP-dependent helicase IRC3
MIRLRPYQEEAVAAVEESKHARPMVVLPTGTGKTVIFAELIKRRRGRALVLAHRDELLTQAEAKIRAVWPEVPEIGRVQADRDELAAHVVLGSVQTLSREARLMAFCAMVGKLDPLRLLIIDEAHHAAADSYVRIVDALTPYGPRVVGFTATPERGDRKNLGTCFDAIVYRKSLLQMIGAGYLCDLRALRVHVAGMSLAGVHAYAGDYEAGELGAEMMRAHAPRRTVEAWQRWAGNRKKTLIFTPTVELASATVEAFRAEGIGAAAVWGAMAGASRAQALLDFARGRTPVLVNCAVLLEGYDEPAIDCVVVARPTLSRVLYQQMIGRGTRVWMGKQDCLILDLVGALDMGMGTCTLAGLLGVREETAEGGVRALLESIRGGRSAEDLVSEPAGAIEAAAVEIVDRSRLSWIEDMAPSGKRYLLAAGDETLVLVQHEGAWAIRSMPRNRQAQSRLLYRDLTLEYASGVAEDYVRRAGVWSLAAADARWRRDEPSDGQIRLLQKMQLAVPKTKGEASDLLSQRFMRYRR